MKKHKNKIIAGVLMALLLILAFYWGGGISQPKETKKEDVSVKTEHLSVEVDAEIKESASDASQVQNKQSEEIKTVESETISAENAALQSDIREEAVQSEPTEKPSDVGATEQPASSSSDTKEKTVRDKYMDKTAVPGKPLPVEPSDTVISDKELTCILSVRCDTILNNVSSLDKAKSALVPADGIIFPEKEVTFYEGETVFNVLMREMKRNKIHLEFENIPLYNSAYIEGIANLYELDCGELSGWMYRVNGWFPNYGCSRYLLKDGDRVEWVYTCDLGADVGD